MSHMVCSKHAASTNLHVWSQSSLDKIDGTVNHSARWLDWGPSPESRWQWHKAPSSSSRYTTRWPFWLIGPFPVPDKWRPRGASFIFLEMVSSGSAVCCLFMAYDAFTFAHVPDWVQFTLRISLFRLRPWVFLVYSVTFFAYFIHVWAGSKQLQDIEEMLLEMVFPCWFYIARNCISSDECFKIHHLSEQSASHSEEN